MQWSTVQQKNSRNNFEKWCTAVKTGRSGQAYKSAEFKTFYVALLKLNKEYQM